MIHLNVVDQTIKKLKTQTANFITLTNLFLGGFAMIAITNGHFNFGLMLIFIAAFFDRLDGMVARKFNITSELGKQLDSMSDIISFGVAPMLLIYHGIVYEFGTVGTFFSILYVACGALRLAKFNITEGNGYFTGLPITVSGCLLTLSYFFIPVFPPHSFIFILFLLSLLMISPIKIKKI